MNNVEMIGLSESTVKKSKDKFFDPQTYDILDFHYHWLMFLSGVFFLAGAHKLSWFIALGWFFLSRLIGMLINRLDITVNGSKIVMLHKTKNVPFHSILNN